VDTWGANKNYVKIKGDKEPKGHYEHCEYMSIVSPHSSLRVLSSLSKLFFFFIFVGEQAIHSLPSSPLCVLSYPY